VRVELANLHQSQLDLSGIAKGFGVDEMARVMDSFRIPAWLVGIDGEMRAKGTKPDGSMWSVAHERPDRQFREAMGVLELQDMAVATSGHYRHYREVDGKIISHTMNPRTGAPLENGPASVTVLAPTCMTADAWATALMVMGVEAGLKIARAQRFDVIFVLRDGSVQTTL
jgi:thiamine biosynthesis lipoprotein